MRRWNGWGEDSTTYPLPSSARIYLEQFLGKGLSIPDISLDDALSLVPPSRFSSNSKINTQSLDRLTHARGQSLPDWIALRSGQIQTFPDGIAYPENRSDLTDLLKYSRDSGTRMIPYGGGTSVVGHINPLPGDEPILTVDLSRLNNLLNLDETSRLATFEAGISGPKLEESLNPKGIHTRTFPAIL